MSWLHNDSYDNVVEKLKLYLAKPSERASQLGVVRTMLEGMYKDAFNVWNARAGKLRESWGIYTAALSKAHGLVAEAYVSRVPSVQQEKMKAALELLQNVEIYVKQLRILEKKDYAEALAAT